MNIKFYDTHNDTSLSRPLPRLDPMRLAVVLWRHPTAEAADTVGGFIKRQVLAGEEREQVLYVRLAVWPEHVVDRMLAHPLPREAEGSAGESC